MLFYVSRSALLRTSTAMALPEPQLIDIEGLQRRLGGDKEATNAVLAAFLQDLPGRMNELKTAVTRGDREQVRYLSHAVKGALLWIGVEGAGFLTESLESSAANDSDAAVKEAAENLRGFVERACGAIESRATAGPD